MAGNNYLKANSTQRLRLALICGTYTVTFPQAKLIRNKKAKIVLIVQRRAQGYYNTVKQENLL